MAPFSRLLLLGVALISSATGEPQSLDGIRSFAERRFGSYADIFSFQLTEKHENPSRWTQITNDNYTVTSTSDGKILVQGTTLNALARGLRHYATDALYLDDFWFVKQRTISKPLPALNETLVGASVVPWRYNFNTVTFSYTFAWYSWEDWEKLLDWAAWRGINLQLAWVGYEKIFLDSFREIGMADDEILAFFSGPAFQAWNRFGNIKGSWGGVGNLTLSWIESQFEMQKKIVARMVELGMTPVLPAFPGFVPDTITRVRPAANVTKAPDWLAVPGYSQDLFLSPLDPTSAELQKLFISKQIEAFGNVTNIYTLDQFNEMQPASGDTAYLDAVSKATYSALTAANPAAIWLMQGWLFYSSEAYWTQERIDAYLGGMGEKNNALILDLYSEGSPQWQRTKHFSGRPWIWCELHDFGGNMNLFGQVSKLTQGPIAALANSTSLVGFGLTPEAYEGNEVVYDLLLDQAWSASAIDTIAYFKEWTTLRYGQIVPSALYKAWDMLRQHVYDMDDPLLPAVGVGVYQLQPALSGLANRTGHFPAPTYLGYDPNVLKQALGFMYDAATENESLWNVPTFQLDVVDVTRQVMGNYFIDLYQDLVKTFNASIAHPPAKTCGTVEQKGQKLLKFLTALDEVLCTIDHFTFAKWLGDAKRWVAGGDDDLISFSARSQVTVWQPDSPYLNDYSARAWGGLTGVYYHKRWAIFVDGLAEAVKAGSIDEQALKQKIHAFEKSWQFGGFNGPESNPASGDVKNVVTQVMKQWPKAFRP